MIGRLLLIIGLKIMPDPEARLIRKFQASRKQVIKRWLDYHHKKISRDQLHTELRQCMVLDDKGTWWATGIERDTWYKFVDGEWERRPLPISMSPDEALEESFSEIAYLYKPFLIDDMIHIQLEPPGPQDPNKVLPPSLNAQLSDEDLEKEAQEALKRVLEKERQQKSQQPSFDEDKSTL